MHVLVVDDDRELAGFLRQGLEEEGYAVTVCTDGHTALQALEKTAFDLVVLDVMMPGTDGLDVTRRLRRLGLDTPVLLLTARDAPRDVVRGLDAGADDYLTKPFPFEVLLARVRARTRPAAGPATALRFADLVLDPGTREVRRGGEAIHLTRTEFSILECLMRAPGRVVSRDRLIEDVWGGRDVSENNLEVFVRHLREKVHTAGRSRLIRTERGIGYGLREH